MLLDVLGAVALVGETQAAKFTLKGFLLRVNSHVFDEIAVGRAAPFTVHALEWFILEMDSTDVHGPLALLPEKLGTVFTLERFLIRVCFHVANQGALADEALLTDVADPGAIVQVVIPYVLVQSVPRGEALLTVVATERTIVCVDSGVEF